MDRPGVREVSIYGGNGTESLPKICDRPLHSGIFIFIEDTRVVMRVDYLYIVKKLCLVTHHHITLLLGTSVLP